MYTVAFEAGNCKGMNYNVPTFDEAIRIYERPVEKIGTDLHGFPGPFVIKLIANQSQDDYDPSCPLNQILDAKIWRS